MSRVVNEALDGTFTTQPGLLLRRLAAVPHHIYRVWWGISLSLVCGHSPCTISFPYRLQGPNYSAWMAPLIHGTCCS